MGNLKKLPASVVLALALGLSAFAGQTDTPPCDPGETHGPPCVAIQMASDDSATPGVISTPPASNAGTEYLVAEAAISLVENLMLF